MLGYGKAVGGNACCKWFPPVHLSMMLLSLRSSSASSPVSQVQASGGLSQPCSSTEKQSSPVLHTRQFPKWECFCALTEEAEFMLRFIGDSIPCWMRVCGYTVCSMFLAEQCYVLQCSICSCISQVIFGSEHVCVVWWWYEPFQLAPQHFYSS